ncbi:hypothetical protein PQ358_006510, partial [Pseudomonas aeruginosa]
RLSGWARSGRYTPTSQHIEVDQVFLRQLLLKFTLFFSLIMLGHLLIPKEVAETLVDGAWRYILCFAGGACGL